MSEKLEVVNIPHPPKKPPYEPAALRRAIKKMDENIARLKAGVRNEEVRQMEYRGYLVEHQQYEDELAQWEADNAHLLKAAGLTIADFVER